MYVCKYFYVNSTFKVPVKNINNFFYIYSRMSSYNAQSKNCASKTLFFMLEILRD